MPEDDEGYWAISAADLYEMLQRVEAGEKAAIVYAEAYATARRSKPTDDD